MVRTIGTENEALMKYLGWVDFEFLQKSIIHTLYTKLFSKINILIYKKSNLFLDSTYEIKVLQNELELDLLLNHYSQGNLPRL